MQRLASGKWEVVIYWDHPVAGRSVAGVTDQETGARKYIGGTDVIKMVYGCKMEWRKRLGRIRLCKTLGRPFATMEDQIRVNLAIFTVIPTFGKLLPQRCLCGRIPTLDSQILPYPYLLQQLSIPFDSLATYYLLSLV